MNVNDQLILHSILELWPKNWETQQKEQRKKHGNIETLNFRVWAQHEKRLRTFTKKIQKKKIFLFILISNYLGKHKPKFVSLFFPTEERKKNDLKLFFLFPRPYFSLFMILFPLYRLLDDLVETNRSMNQTICAQNCKSNESESIVLSDLMTWSLQQ